MGLIFSQPKSLKPAKVPTDGVFPFHYLNNQQLFRHLVPVLMLRFNVVLDPEKLYISLKQLLELPNWKEFGGRVRQNVGHSSISIRPRCHSGTFKCKVVTFPQINGDLEYHVPEVYDEKRPGFAWSNTKFDTLISEHPVASQLPSSEQYKCSEPQFFSDPAIFGSLLEPPNLPRDIEDWTKTDRPPLSIHVVSFEDATLINLSWNHSFMDGMGCAAFVKAWTSMLLKAPVPQFVTRSEDPIQILSTKATVMKEEYALYNWALKGSRFFGFILTQMWDWVWNPNMDVRVIALPASFVDRLKKDASDNGFLAAANRDDAKKTPFISDNDVLSAWMARAAAKSLKLSSWRPVAITNIADIRGTIEDVVPAEHAYIGNAVFPIAAITDAGKLAHEPLGATALTVRKALEQQRTRRQVEAHVEADKEATQSGGIPLFGPWNMAMLTISNWHKARFYDFDFSPAVVQSGVSSNEKVVGKPVYIHSTVYDSGAAFRNFGMVIGKDHHGTWWMTLALAKRAWKEFERISKSGLPSQGT